MAQQAGTSPEVLVAMAIAKRAGDILAHELAERRPTFATFIADEQQRPVAQQRASIVGGVRPVERLISFNTLEGQVETLVPGGQLPIIQLLIGSQPFSLAVIMSTDVDDDGALRWVPMAAIEGVIARVQFAPVPLIERAEHHVFPLIDTILEIVDVGMQELGIAPV